jgi:hypothetical protein
MDMFGGAIAERGQAAPIRAIQQARREIFFIIIDKTSFT